MGEQSDRTQNGRFAAGNGGGPGRPPGYRSRIAAKLDQISEEACANILDKLISQAMQGDFQSQKFILERCWPVSKARTVTFELPPIEGAADRAKALGAILDAVTRGDLTPEQGKAVADVVELKIQALRYADESTMETKDVKFYGTTAELLESIIEANKKNETEPSKDKRDPEPE